MRGAVATTVSASDSKVNVWTDQYARSSIGVLNITSRPATWFDETHDVDPSNASVAGG